MHIQKANLIHLSLIIDNIVMNRFFKISLLILLLASFSSRNLSANSIKLNINTKYSLLRTGVDPSNRTNKGKDIAEILYDALEAKSIAMIAKSSENLQNIQVEENNTLDYSALKWLCDKIIEEKTINKTSISDNLSLDYYKYFTSDNFKVLKEYLLVHYGIKNYKPTQDVQKVKDRITFLEDLLLFNDPSRTSWDYSDKIINLLKINSGDKVIDIGSGLGYYSLKLRNLVGDTGLVYSVDTNNNYIQYLSDFSKSYNYKNITTINSKENNISVNDKADVAFMCSLYHIIYGWSQEGNRKAFINSIKQSLKPGGKFYIIDNNFLNGKELNNCYIYKELIISQLQMYGFRFDNYYDISEKRYMLEFTYTPGSISTLSINEKDITNTNHILDIVVKDSKSLIHIGSLDSYDTTPKGILGAKMVVNILTTKNMRDAKDAVIYYNTLIPNENFGGEYTALQWFCKYISSPRSLQKAMLKDQLIKSYYEYLSAGNYKLLKNYILYKYKLIDRSKIDIKKDINDGDDASKEIGKTQRAFIEDFILFNNPQRETWEKSSEILTHLPFKSGDKIVDLGSGSGYYSYKFSNIVGNTGKVYAIDTKSGHLDFINSFTKQNSITNISTVKVGEDQGYRIPEKADYVFTCSLYHIVYGVFSHNEREIFINSILNSLKEDGKLIIVDNSPVNDTTLPYHGPYITKELIISQLSHYGFELSEYYQTIPQRYVLIFKKTAH